MPKYVAPNLRGPKLVWVPSKSGWICVGTMALEAWLKLISFCSSYIESSYKAQCISYPNAKSKWVKSKVLQHTSVIYQVVDDLLELFDGLQFIWVKACYWMIMS
jgi:hypothetical protein